jgi:hypothetical protein
MKPLLGQFAVGGIVVIPVFAWGDTLTLGEWALCWVAGIVVAICLPEDYRPD